MALAFFVISIYYLPSLLALYIVCIKFGSVRFGSFYFILFCFILLLLFNSTPFASIRFCLELNGEVMLSWVPNHVNTLRTILFFTLLYLTKVL